MPTSNRILDPGNMQVANPYFITARTGTLTGLNPGDAVASLVNLGAIINGAPVPMSLHVSQLKLLYVPITTPAVNGIAFEVVAGGAAALVQHNVGGALRAAQKRNRNIQDIPTTEVSLYAAATGVISGGNLAADDATAPFDMMALSGGTDLAGSESIWTPVDLHPEELSANRGLEVRARAFSGTGILFVRFDFLR
jgi:hypothetical protein